MTSFQNNDNISFDGAAWAQCAAQRSSNGGWQNPQLTPLGLYYPLGPCRATFDKSRLENVLRALDGVFRFLSLETIFQDAPISATCRSLEQVEFVVSILEARDNQVILEIQRYTGDTIVYHRYAREILRAVATGNPSPTQSLLGKRRVPLARKAISESDQKAIVKQAIEQGWEMLRKDRHDAQKLGLESLLHTTDPSVSGLSNATMAAEFLLDPKDSIPQQVSMQLAELVCGNESQDNKCASSDSLALAVLSHIFHLGSMSGVQRFLIQSPPGFMDALRSAQNDPHKAYYATKCLTALSESLPERGSPTEK